MTLATHQQRVDRWISQFEEGYFHPLTNLARLTEEVGEFDHANWWTRKAPPGDAAS